MLQRFPLNSNAVIVDEDSVLKSTVRECMNALIDARFFHRRGEVRKMDTIDVSAYAKGNCDGNPACMPSLQQTPQEREALANYWCMAVPPLLKGVVLINELRYLVYWIDNIDLDEKSYDITIVDYGYDMDVWTYNSTVNATIFCSRNGHVHFHVRGADVYDVFEAVFIEKLIDMGKYYPDKHTIENLKKYVLPKLKMVKRDDEFDDVLNHFISAIVKVNYELMHGEKPKAVRTKKKPSMQVKTVVDKEPEKKPKPQIVRTLKSGVLIKSEKVPKAPTVEVIRHYKIASWSVRGHMRHYKDGKTVYIMPTVHKRKEFENKDAAKRQTIIISGRKGESYEK